MSRDSNLVIGYEELKSLRDYVKAGVSRVFNEKPEDYSKKGWKEFLNEEGVTAQADKLKRINKNVTAFLHNGFDGDLAGGESGHDHCAASRHYRALHDNYLFFIELTKDL